MAAEHWLRWHHGTATDPKFRVIAARASAAMSRNVTVSHALSIWAMMLECASQSSPRGELSGWDDEDVAACLGLDTELVAAVREAMQGKVLDGNVLTGWERRQPKAEDRSAAARKRAQRERERAQIHDVTASDTGQCHVMSRNVTTETETETETEKARAVRSPAGSRLPDDWALSAELRDWTRANAPWLNIDLEAEKFRDYWAAKPGKEGRKASWEATWRNWARRAAPVAAAPMAAVAGGGRAEL